MIMDRKLFPQSGRIVILDDKSEEVAGLMICLSQHAIPFLYLDYVPDEYNEYESLGIRIIFLDLVLTAVTDEKTVKSVLMGSLDKLLKKSNGPFVMAIWSTQREHYYRVIEGIQKKFKPEKVVYLDKSKYKTYNQGLLQDLSEHLVSEFRDCKLLQYISLWENIIKQSTVDITAKINSLVLCSGDKRVDCFASSVASLTIGPSLLKSTSLNNQQKTRASYEGLNTLLNKQTDIEVDKISTEASGLVSIKQIEPKISDVDINTLLWLGEPFTYCSPKNVYKARLAPTIKKAIGDYDYKRAVYFELDITHKCTFVNNGTDHFGHQLVKGALFEAESFKNKKEYWKKIGKIKFKGKIMDMFIFLGEIVNRAQEALKIDKAIFSISDEVYAEVRASIGNIYTKSGKREL